MWFARFLLVPATAVAFVLPDPRRCAVPCMSSRSPTTTTLMAPTPSPVSVFDADGDELDAANAKEDIVQVVKSYYDQQYRQAAKQRNDWTFTPGLGWVGPSSTDGVGPASTVAAKVFAPATLMCKQSVEQSIAKLRDYKERAKCVGRARRLLLLPLSRPLFLPPSSLPPAVRSRLSCRLASRFTLRRSRQRVGR